MRKLIAILPLFALLLTGCDMGTTGTKVSGEEFQPKSPYMQLMLIR